MLTNAQICELATLAEAFAMKLVVKTNAFCGPDPHDKETVRQTAPFAELAQRLHHEAQDLRKSLKPE